MPFLTGSDLFRFIHIYFLLIVNCDPNCASLSLLLLIHSFTDHQSPVLARVSADPEQTPGRLGALGEFNPDGRPGHCTAFTAYIFLNVYYHL